LQLVFADRSRCIVGRANDCDLCLPSDLQVQVENTIFRVGTLVPVKGGVSSSTSPEEHTEDFELSNDTFLCDICRKDEPESCVVKKCSGEEMAVA
jgi:hypothetical protein